MQIVLWIAFTALNVWVWRCDAKASREAEEFHQEAMRLLNQATAHAAKGDEAFSLALRLLTGNR